MIHVQIEHDDGTLLSEARIHHVGNTEEGWGRYSVQVAVERLGAVGLYQRTFVFPRLHGNALALVIAAFSSLDLENLELENAPVGPSDLARRQRGVVGEIQAGPG